MATRSKSAGLAKVLLPALALAGSLVLVPVEASPVEASATVDTVAAAPVADVLKGDTWLRHHRDDLMPYWDMPAALGDPVGNFPSFRGRDGELLPEGNTGRGLSTLARGVYGYSLAFMLTGEQRYLTYAKAGIDWINTKAKDPVYGGFYGNLDADGEPVNEFARKDVFDLASLGLAYGMYFNVTRDPAAEADLLAVRDLLFDKYYDPVGNRIKDSLSYDLLTEVDTGGNGGDGGDITDLLVPGTAIFLPNASLLTDPARRAQFRNDLRRVTEILIARHKNSAAPSNRWWFWGRTLRFGQFGASETDFGHNVKTYEMIHNANQVYPDRPWSGLVDDRDRMMTRAWDDPVARWNQRLINFGIGNVERDSAWWVHAEADQTLAALDLSNDFDYQIQLARSAQSWLDVYVDRTSPARETFARIARIAADNDLRKSFFGKNMLHAHEHALIMYLHGRALEGLPARLYYAFPEGQALTAVAKPYWFDAAAESRIVSPDLATLPGHQVVEVSFDGIGRVPAPPYPAPDDNTAPATVTTVSPAASAAGWHRGDVTVSLWAADDLVGVKEIHVRIEKREGVLPGTAFIDPGTEFVLPPLSAEGRYDITYFAIDRLGNEETSQTLEVRIDRTPPTMAGLPSAPCVIWPPNMKMVHVADVVGADALSGIADVHVTGTSSEPAAPSDIVVVGGSVDLLATRDDEGPGRTYTLEASVTDRADNTLTDTATCLVPHDLRR